MGPNPERRSILIADGEPVYRAGLTATLPEYQVYGYGIDVGNHLRRHKLDLAIVGKLPKNFDVPNLIRNLKRQQDIPVVTIIGDQDNKYIREAIASGATGFVERDNTLEKTLEAIQSVLVYGAYTSPSLFSRVISIPGAISVFRQPNQESPHFTPRELEVWTLLADGNSNKLIARKLLITPYTVRNHVQNLFEKLEPQLGGPEGRNRTQLTRLAIAQGIVPNPAISQSS